MVNGVWYKPVEQFILPKVSFSFLNRASPTCFKALFHTSNVDKSYCPFYGYTHSRVCVSGSLPQGFEGTLVWESLGSGGLCTISSSSVELSDGGGVLKISSVRTCTVQRLFLSSGIRKPCFLGLQIAEGTLPHRSALGFPGLAGGFTFTIYGWSRSTIIQTSAIRAALLPVQRGSQHLCANKRSIFIHSGRL